MKFTFLKILKCSFKSFFINLVQLITEKSKLIKRFINIHFYDINNIIDVNDILIITQILKDFKKEKEYSNFNYKNYYFMI